MRQPRVEFASEVLQQIRQHAHSSMTEEICGVLIGSFVEGTTRITARIPGEGAAQGGAHVTFTQDTWEHIYKIKDQDFSDQLIVGWYHSHPGFGIFLSDYDLFIHGNFFNAPHQIAWVVDPHSDEEGCFGWNGEQVEPLEEITVLRTQPIADLEPGEQSTLPVSAKKSALSRDQHEVRQLKLIAILLLVILAFVGGFAARSYLPEILQFTVTAVQKVEATLFPSRHTKPSPTTQP